MTQAEAREGRYMWPLAQKSRTAYSLTVSGLFGTLEAGVGAGPRPSVHVSDEVKEEGGIIFGIIEPPHVGCHVLRSSPPAPARPQPPATHTFCCAFSTRGLSCLRSARILRKLKRKGM